MKTLTFPGKFDDMIAIRVKDWNHNLNFIMTTIIECFKI